MGFLSNLLGMTGPGRFGAALNALTAKYMFDNCDEEAQDDIHGKIIELYMSGTGTPFEIAMPAVNGLRPTAYYGICAVVFMYLQIPPYFSKCFAAGRWNQIDNPLVALSETDNELQMARIDIFKRYQIDVVF